MKTERDLAQGKKEITTLLFVYVECRLKWYVSLGGLGKYTVDTETERIK